MENGTQKGPNEPVTVADTPDGSPGGGTSGASPNNPPPHKNSRWLTVIAVIVILVLLAFGIIPRIRQQKQISAAAADVKKSHPIVNVVKATESAPESVVDLPGTIEAAEQTSINARATGYVSKVLVDIGDRVTAGQTLAIISAPDTDQQTAQGRAQLAQSQAAVAQAQANLSAMEGALAQQQANLGHSRAAYLQAKAAVYQQEAQLAQAQNQYKEQQQAVNEQVANTNLAQVTNQRQQYLFQQGAIAKQDADQAEATSKVNVAGLSLNQSALAASQSNINAYVSNVAAGKANQQAAAQDVNVAQAEVATAISNIRAAQSSVAAAQATVSANDAALQRLVDLQSYENVTAPFSGVITSRSIDPGAYISGGSSAASTSAVGSNSAGTGVSGGAASGSTSTGSTSSTTSVGTSSGAGSGGASAGLFTVASIDRLRIYLNLPQMYVDAIQVGQPATITARSLPNKTFNGTVTQSAVALDPTSRTLVAEVQLPNPGQILRPGMFGDVKITVPQAERVLMIPDPALLTSANGPEVVVVKADKTIHFQPITIGEDDGTNLQVLSGLMATDRIVAAPNYNLFEGEKVTVQKAVGGKKRGPKA